MGTHTGHSLIKHGRLDPSHVPQMVESGAKTLLGHRHIAHPGLFRGMGHLCVLEGVSVYLVTK